MAKYCVLYSIIASDPRAATRNTGLGIAEKAIGRDPDGAGNFDRYVLGQGGTPALDANSEEIDLIAVIGHNEDINPATLNDLASLQTSAISRETASPPATREELQARIRQRAGQLGASKVWTLIPGDSTTTANNAALVAKFEPL